MSEFKFVPDKNRLFTTQEIAIACSCTLPTVRGFARKYGYEPEQVQSCDEGKKAVWNFDFYKAFSDYHKMTQSRKKAEKKETAAEPKDLEELKKLHLNVTDTRCFNLNWWPETTPDNLAEYMN